MKNNSGDNGFFESWDHFYYDKYPVKVILCPKKEIFNLCNKVKQKYLSR